VRVCPVGGVVLDPFAGSGTTLVAALKSGRNAVGVEMVPEIADIAERRLRDASSNDLSLGLDARLRLLLTRRLYPLLP
jgi:site-specific DNA-methyltransferase (adenine-specific)